MNTNTIPDRLETSPNANDEVEQHSIGRSVLLHLLPGALITLFFIIFGPMAERWGAPAIMVIFTGILLIMIPFELGYMLYEGKKQTGRFSLSGIVVYRRRIPLWQYLVLVPFGLAWMLFVFFIVTRPIDSFLIERLFSWVPAWFFGAARSLDLYAPPVLLSVAVMALLFNGITGPVVEELYFRGYLLPRISRLGHWAPIFSSVLFSVYHFFTPWQNPARLMVLIPFTYIVRWNKNIYWGMIVHASLNTIAMILLFGPIL